jgi:hypothetical protein
MPDEQRQVDVDLIVPGRDRLWAIHGQRSWVSYVVAETAGAALGIAGDAADEDSSAGTTVLSASELPGPVEDGDAVVAWGHSLHGDEQLTVNQTFALLAERARVDTVTMPMPFVDTPAAPREGEDAAGTTGTWREVSR